MQSITLQIEDEDFPKLTDGVFYNNPVPLIPVLDSEGMETFDENDELITEPQYTDLEWLKVLAMNNYSVLYCRGIKKRDGDIGRQAIDTGLMQRIIASNLQGET